MDIEKYLSSVGRSFIMGQGMQLASSAYHSLIHAPRGSKVRNLFYNYAWNSQTGGIQMAKWSVVSTALEPLFEDRFKRKWVEGMAVGAATGALLEIRSGLSGMAQGALSGASQSLGMSVINSVIYYAAAPVRNHLNQRSLARFNEERGKSVFSTPLDVLTKAFF